MLPILRMYLIAVASHYIIHVYRMFDIFTNTSTESGKLKQLHVELPVPSLSASVHRTD